MSGQEKRLTMVASGTGGHVFPRPAVAHHLMDQGQQVRWLGTADRMEADLVPRNGTEINFTCISGLRGKGIKAQLLAPVRIFNAWRQARAIMKRLRPDVVLGMGGYVFGPSGLTAWSLGIPVVLHEQSGIAGLTNKWLTRITKKVTQAFPGASPHTDVVGDPVRTDVLALPLLGQRLVRRHGPTRVLVVGDSQGTRVLNQTMPQVATKPGDAVATWYQSGKGGQQTMRQAYAAAGQPQHKMTGFIDDIATAYTWADVVICRSGALTVSEVMITGLPALFVSFQHKDRQQYWNTLSLERAGAAKILEQPEFTVEAVTSTLASWDREALLDMAERARGASIPDATGQVAEEVSAVALTR